MSLVATSFARVVLLAAALFAFAPGFASAQTAAKPNKSLDNIVFLYLKDGVVIIQMRPDLAPDTVKRIKRLTHEGFYNGLLFHRVIAGFMAQTGDPTGTGMGGSPYPNVKAEFSKAPFVRGTVGMARSSDPNSANSQFFICFAPAPFLNGKYTVWGQVIAGMNAVDKIKKGNPQSGAVNNPDHIVKMVLASDSKDAAAKAEAQKLLQQQK